MSQALRGEANRRCAKGRYEQARAFVERQSVSGPARRVRPLSDPETTRPGRHGRGLPGPGFPARTASGPQGAVLRGVGIAAAGRAVRARGPVGGGLAASQHLHRFRRRPDRRPAVHHDGVHCRYAARRGDRFGSTDAASPGRRDRPQDRPRPGTRPPQGDRPSRPEAGERDDGGRRRAGGHGLRPGETARWGTQSGQADPARRHPRHSQLHVPGTGQRGRFCNRPGHGHLCTRRDAVRDAHRENAVYRRDERRDWPDPDRPGAAGAGVPPGRAFPSGRHLPQGHGEGAGRPIFQHGGVCGRAR